MNLIKLAACLSLPLMSAQLSAIVLTSPTEDWTAVELGGRSDYVEDTQANSGGDIVGDADGNQAGFYKKYDTGSDPNSVADDSIGFRVRLADDRKTDVFVGLDVFDSESEINGPDGAIDFYLRVNFGDQKASSNVIDFYNPGNDLNISPDTTSVSLSSNYKTGDDSDFGDYQNLSVVSDANDSYLANNPGPGTTDLDEGGANDFFLSFRVDMPSLNQAFQSIVSASTGITPDPLDAGSAMQLILSTSNQSNSLNQDFAGSDPNDPDYDGGKTWAELGMASAPYTAEGTSPIPEPAAYGLLIALSASIVTACRRRRVR